MAITDRILRYAAFIMGLWLATASAYASPPSPYPLEFKPGTAEENAFLLKTSGATFEAGARHAEPGQFWVYGIPGVAGSHCQLTLKLDSATPVSGLQVSVLDDKMKPFPIRIETGQEGNPTIIWTLPDRWPVGARSRVILSAKKGPITLQSAVYTHTDRDSADAGVPDGILDWLSAGLPKGKRAAIIRPPGQPYTVAQTATSPTPRLDPQTDVALMTGPDATTIRQWKERGYTTWTLGSERLDKGTPETPDHLQIGIDGKPVTLGDAYLLSPTADGESLRSLFDTAIAAGSEGICLSQPEFLARGGYGDAFKQAWQTRYGAKWQDPASSIGARFDAGQLMASLEATQVSTLFQDISAKSPGTQRIVELLNPLECGQAGIVSPAWQIISQPTVENVLARLDMEGLLVPARYAGVRQELPFAQAYLGYSALRNITRYMGRRLWLTLEPAAGNATVSDSDYKSRFEYAVTASLLFSDINSYKITSNLERIYGGAAPTDYAVEVNNVMAALQEMHTQVRQGGLSPEDIGVLISDSMQWQREGPARLNSEMDSIYGLTLPLLQRGIPVQIVSLDRSADAGYLNRFKTLLLSYDYQKPLDARTQSALAEWVRRGGSLLFFGGSDPYNEVQDSWWRQAKLLTPQMDLWTKLGLIFPGPATTQSASAEDLSKYRTLLSGDRTERNLQNRRKYTFDLTPFTRSTGSAAVRFAAVQPVPGPQDGRGAFVGSAELRIDGKLAAAFLAGSEIENRFLVFDNNSEFDGAGRTADGPASWTYQFDGLPKNAQITLSVDMGNGFLVQAAPAQPDFGHTLLTTHRIAGLAEAFPRLRIGASYPATLYPLPDTRSDITRPDALDTLSGRKDSSPGALRVGLASNGQAGGRSIINRDNRHDDELTALYTLRSGGTPVWLQKIGKGLLLHVGIAPGFFSSSERSAGLLRALTRLAYQRAGGSYREPGTLHLQRGRYTIVRTFGASEVVDGRTIDLFSPTLGVTEDREIPPRSVAVLVNLGSSDAPPHIGFVSGRVQARVESPQTTAFFVRGPQGGRGVARLHRGSKRLTGARGIDRMGRPVSIETIQEGSTVLLRYPNYPDGIAIRVGWQ